MLRRPLVLGLALVALALVVYLLASPATPEQAAVAEPVEEAPSADNVDPAFHGEMMRLKAAAEEAPEDLEAQLAFARMALGAHRGAEAAEALERAVALGPEERQPWIDLALAYAAAEEWDASAEASRRMLARFPGDAEAQYNLGAAHANAGRLQEARAAWEAVPEDTPTAALASSSLTQLAAMEGAPAAPATPTAPPLDPGQTTLPEGHPPLPAGHPPIASTASGCTSGTCADGGACSGDCAGGCNCGGVETRVMEGGRTDARAVRSLVTTLAGQE